MGFFHYKATDAATLHDMFTNCLFICFLLKFSFVCQIFRDVITKPKYFLQIKQNSICFTFQFSTMSLFHYEQIKFIPTHVFLIHL